MPKKHRSDTSNKTDFHKNLPALPKRKKHSFLRVRRNTGKPVVKKQDYHVHNEHVIFTVNVAEGDVQGAKELVREIAINVYGYTPEQVEELKVEVLNSTKKEKAKDNDA